MNAKWLTLTCLLALCGCKSLGLDRKDKDKDDAAKPAGTMPERSAKELIDYLNSKAALVQSISYSDVSLTATENGKDMPRLGDSSLFASKPQNFRLLCGTNFTSGEVDLGSNDREFWMYVKRMDGPNFFYCSHEEFARGAGKRFPIPFDTKWVMQALGMADYDVNGQFEVRTYAKQRKYVLEEKATTPNGVPVRRLVVFNTDHEGGRKPVVAKHLVVDDRDQPIASAEIVSAKSVLLRDASGQQSYVQVPTEVVLEWPQQKFKMRLVLDREKVNEDLRQRSALFTRPEYKGANAIDLANYNAMPNTR